MKGVSEPIGLAYGKSIPMLPMLDLWRAGGCRYCEAHAQLALAAARLEKDVIS